MNNNFKFMNNNDGTCTVIGVTNNEAQHLVVPSRSPDGLRVTSIGDYAFSDCTSLTSIEIPVDVTSIGDSAFSGCKSLASVTFGENSQLTSIGKGAFSDCTSLTSIEIPDSVTSIGEWAFCNCTSLESIEIPAGVTSIGDSAFYGCKSLTSIEIPASVTRIGYYAFRNCTSLTSVTFAENSQLTSIGPYAFAYCGSLVSPQNNYKAFALTRRKNLRCRNKTYYLGKRSLCRGLLSICKNGLHFCTNIFDIFNYYSGEYGKHFVIALCDVADEQDATNAEDSKRCARWIRPTKILTREELIQLLNTRKKE